MLTICALIAVDTEGALSVGTAVGNAYLVDTNGYLGSWQEATDALHTICQDGQTLTWSVRPISPGGIVSISGFSGQMVASGVCSPIERNPAGDSFWTGKVESQGAYASFPYTVTLSLEGSELTLNAFVKTV